MEDDQSQGGLLSMELIHHKVDYRPMEIDPS